jgi:Bacterial alpha-L-rhamnosidase 6 hairpin glycosidase domain/Bacterial alpha-L-rhamnosidase C-terminal domain
MLAPGGQTYDALGDYCPTPAGTKVILDGTVRDRCPYIGDETVIDQTYDATDPHWDVQRTMLALFSAGQARNGAIPSAPFSGGTVLFDYCAYWAIALHNYVLFSGDVPFAREQWPHLVRLMDVWFPLETGPDGLLVNDLGNRDYAFIPRDGTTVAYYNAEYVLALRQAAELARWLGHTGEQAAWSARAEAVTRAFDVFWDAANGAYVDTTVDRLTHPQDGNAFAVIAHIASHERAVAALDHLAAHDSYSYGNSIADVPTWDDPVWGIQSNMRVYPFMSFYELLARFQARLDGSALNLMRREWGYMLQSGPGTDWELIAPYGGGPTDQRLGGGWDVGWSSGATAALTQYVLGVRPTSPGYATYVVDPHPDPGVWWASGDVVTPRGLLHVQWHEVQAATGTKLVVESHFVR